MVISNVPSDVDNIATMGFSTIINIVVIEHINAVTIMTVVEIIIEILDYPTKSVVDIIVASILEIVITEIT